VDQVVTRVSAGLVYIIRLGGLVHIIRRSSGSIGAMCECRFSSQDLRFRVQGLGRTSLVPHYQQVVCVCVCVCVCEFVCEFVFVCLSLYTCVYIHTYKCMHVCTYVLRPDSPTHTIYYVIML